MGPKKSTATKCACPSSSIEFDHHRFVSAEVEALFQSSITRRSGIKERGFEIDSENARTEGSTKPSRSTGGNYFAVL